MRILLIDDDVKFCSYIKLGLEESNYKVDVANDGMTGEKLAAENKYTVIIMDVMLPKINGFDLCKRIRNNNIKTPILMLTALDSSQDIVEGLECGADDYLSKPFSLHVLLARIKALDRRYKEIFVSTNLTMANLELNTLTKKAIRDGKVITLTAIEYKLLELLLANKEKVFDRTEIGEKVWGHSFNTGTNVIDVHINTLRNKIDKDFSPKLIHTLVGIGYVMKEND